MQKSLNFSDISKIIRNINPDCRFKIETYDYVDRFKDAKSLMSGLDALILLYRTNPLYGHYVVLTQCDTPEYREYIQEVWHQRTDLPVYCFVDSYGMMVDKELDFVPERLKGILGQEFPVLRQMLKDCPNIVEWNHHKLQGPDANTCGRYAALRAAEYCIPLETWVRQLRVRGKTPDRVITMLTSIPSLSGGFKSNPNRMFGSGGTRSKRARSKLRKTRSKSKRRLRDSGAVVQTVKVHIGDKAIAERPMYVPDSRLDAVNPYASPRLRVTEPREVIRPTQAGVFPGQIQIVEHNANGTVTANLQLASAVAQLANSLPGIRSGMRRWEAGQEESRKFMTQSSQIGGAGPAVQVADQMGRQRGGDNERQRRLLREIESSRPYVPLDPEVRPDVTDTVNSILAVDSKEIERRGDQNPPPPEPPVLVHEVETRQPISMVSTTLVRNTRPPTDRVSILQRHGGGLPPVPEAQFSAFSILGGPESGRRGVSLHDRQVVEEKGPSVSTGYSTRQDALSRQSGQTRPVTVHFGQAPSSAPSRLDAQTVSRQSISPRTMAYARESANDYLMERDSPHPSLLSDAMELISGEGLRKKRQVSKRKVSKRKGH